MIAEQLINYKIPPLKPTDDITRARQWMDEFHLRDLAVVDESKLMGFVSEDLLHDSGLVHSKVDNYPLIGQSYFVTPWVHYYDILKMQGENEIDMIAVVENEIFKGVVLIADVMKELAKTAMVSSHGAIIIAQTSLNNYALSEISRIVEMNGSTVLGANIGIHSKDQSQIEITLRISNQDINQIVKGLEKSGYHIISSFNTFESSFDEQKRFDLLMKYLEA